MKKVLHVVSTINPKYGGVSEAIRNLEVGFQALKTSKLAERHVLCLDNEEEINEWNNHGLIVHGIGSVNNIWQYHKGLYKWLKLNCENFDVIIVHGMWLYHSFAVYKAISFFTRKRIKCPTYYLMPHGMLDPWFQNDRSRKLKALRNEVYWFCLEKEVINNASGILFTCEQELILARETFKGYRPKKELNIGLGIQSTPEFTDSMRPAIDNKPYWIFLSRIHEKKGVDLLICAYKELLEHNAQIPDLVVAGPKNTDYAKKMVQLASNCEKIHFPGMLQGDQKWGAIYGAEAFILPSHQENFGIAVVEALACGVPVLISDQVNIWKEIKDGGAGLVEKDTLEGILSLLEKWLTTDSNTRKIMAERAIGVYNDCFDVEIAAKRLLEVILK
ncbi:MAG: glycosyltransferase [Ignavibacteriaceae bacterium]|nr:glycosyltransferase [Ignavibacteriaceae bacterium]